MSSKLNNFLQHHNIVKPKAKKLTKLHEKTLLDLDRIYRGKIADPIRSDPSLQNWIGIRSDPAKIGSRSGSDLHRSDPPHPWLNG